MLQVMGNVETEIQCTFYFYFLPWLLALIWWCLALWYSAILHATSCQLLFVDGLVDFRLLYFPILIEHHGPVWMGWQVQHRTKASQSRSQVTYLTQIVPHNTLDTTTHWLRSNSTVRSNRLQGINNSCPLIMLRLSRHRVWVVEPFHRCPMWNLRGFHLIICKRSRWCSNTCLCL